MQAKSKQHKKLNKQTDIQKTTTMTLKTRMNLKTQIQRFLPWKLNMAQGGK